MYVNCIILACGKQTIMNLEPSSWDMLSNRGGTL